MFSTRLAALLLIVLSSPLFAGLSARVPIQILTPVVSMLDTSTNRVQVTVRVEMVLAGDLNLRLRVPPQVQDLPANSAMTTELASQGLFESDVLNQSFAVHLPDNGHFGFSAVYSFAPSGTISDDDLPLIEHGTIPIYVTMKDGSVVFRNFLYPDPTYVGRPMVVTRTSRSDEPPTTQHTITVRIEGRVSYEAPFPDGVTLGVPGVQIRLDWELFDDPPSDDNPKAISQPPGHPDVAALTDMNGNYSFDFSFVAEHSARHYGTRIRVVAEVENAAAFDGILGRGAIFGDHAYVDIPSEGNDITAQDRDLNVDEIPGAALRFLYRARQFTIDELDYTPVGDQGQVRFFFLPNRFPDTGGVFYCNGSSPFDSGSPCIGTCDTDAPVNLNDLSNNCQPIPPQSADRIVWGRDPDAGSGYHEYGHFVEFDKVGKQVYDDIGGPHTFVTISTDNVAWTEGWAELSYYRMLWIG